MKRHILRFTKKSTTLGMEFLCLIYGAKYDATANGVRVVIEEKAHESRFFRGRPPNTFTLRVNGVLMKQEFATPMEAADVAKNYALDYLPNRIDGWSFTEADRA